MDILLNTFLRAALLFVFVYLYLQTKRKSALFFGIALLLSIGLHYSAHMGNAVLFALTIGVVGTGIITALNVLLDEENINTMMPRTIKMASYLLPVASSVFGALSLELGVGSPTGAVSYPFVITGITLGLAGSLIIEFLGKRYGWRAYLFGASIVLLGVGAVGIAIMIGNRQVLIVEPSDLLTMLPPIIVVVTYALLVLAGGMIKEAPEGINIKPGVTIARRIDERSLKDYPVLAFMRKRLSIPGWKTYWITPLGRDETSVYPTELHKIVDMVARYTAEAKSKGVTPVVLIDGLELLAMYNELKAILKALATIHDILAVEGGALIILLEEGAWDKRDLELLRSVLGVKAPASGAPKSVTPE